MTEPNPFNVSRIDRPPDPHRHQLLILAGISLFASIKVLKEHERGVVLTLGRLAGVKGPGLVLLIPFIQLMIRVDLNTVQDFNAMVSESREPKRDMRKIVDRHTDA